MFKEFWEGEVKPHLKDPVAWGLFALPVGTVWCSLYIVYKKYKDKKEVSPNNKLEHLTDESDPADSRLQDQLYQLTASMLFFVLTIDTIIDTVGIHVRTGEDHVYSAQYVATPPLALRAGATDRDFVAIAARGCPTVEWEVASQSHHPSARRAGDAVYVRLLSLV